MRVLVATDSIGALSAAEAGRAIAEGWQQALPDAQLAVVPLGEAGEGFARCVADQTGYELELVSEPGAELVSQVPCPEAYVVAAESMGRPPARGIDHAAGSAGFGYAAAAALAQRPTRLYLDLAGQRCHDAGAGLLGALGATADRPLDAGVAGLEGIGRLDLGPARAAVGETELIAVVPSAEVGQHLLGLRGITSLRGREVNADPADMLAVDSTLERFAGLADPESSALPGAGAAGGTAFAVAALGGRVLSGPQAAAELAGLHETANVAQLIVSGTSSFDFGSRGGGVLQYVADLAQKAMRPCIVLAGDVVIGSREMRTMGIESAYSVHEHLGTPDLGDRPDGRDVRAADLRALAARIAHSWAW